MRPLVQYCRVAVARTKKKFESPSPKNQGISVLYHFVLHDGLIVH